MHNLQVVVVVVDFVPGADVALDLAVERLPGFVVVVVVANPVQLCMLQADV